VSFLLWRHNNKQNDIQHYDTQYNGIHHNNKINYGTQHNDTLQLCNYVIISIIVGCHHAECYNCKCHSLISPLRLVSLCWVSLCRVSLCWMSLWWVSLWWVSWRLCFYSSKDKLDNGAILNWTFSPAHLVICFNGAVTFSKMTLTLTKFKGLVLQNKWRSKITPQNWIFYLE
jgi:hypothetical protein